MENLELVKGEDVITQQLQKFDPLEAGIAKIEKDYMSLKIDSIQDKEGYRLVSVARKDVKAKRVETDKLRKALNEDALAYQRAVNGKAKEVISRIEAVENYLEGREKWFENELEQIRLEKERKEQERIQVRINAITQYGMSFTSGIYRLGDCEISSLEVTIMPDDKFELFTAEVKAEFDKEQERLAEIERAKEAEADRLRLQAEEQAAERIRLQAIADEQKKKADALQALQDEINMKQKAIDDEILRKANEEKSAKEKAANDLKIAADLEAARKEEREKTERDTAERLRKEAQDKIEKENADRAAAEKEASLRPDKTKLLAFSSSILALPRPELTTDAGIKAMTRVEQLLKKLSDFVAKEVAEMQ